MRENAAPGAGEAAVPQTLPAAPPARSLLKRRMVHILRYWMQTEVHVHGFSVAANVLLSLFPFLIVMFSVCRHILGWHSAADAIDVALNDYFPGQLGQHETIFDFIHRNLLDKVGDARSLQLFSLFLLLFTANGVFEPLEVALNRVWGITKNRSFVRNQLISLGLIFTLGTLALASTVLTGLNAKALGQDDSLGKILIPLMFKMAAVPITVLMLFLTYWLLPNGRIPWRLVLPPAIIVGLAIEIMKYVNLVTWPLWLGKLTAEYGPFRYSVMIILWSFLGSMLVLAGAEWAAAAARERSASEESGEPGAGAIASLGA